MSRETFVMRGGRLVRKSEAMPRAGDARVHVISDTMVPTWHPADGRRYDSKAAFRAVTRAHGCIEVGNERLEPRSSVPRRSPVAPDVARAIEQLSNR
jgi:hypothetical protein